MSSGGLFSFNPAAGESPETLKRRRAVAEAMLANATGQPASTIGGGLAALGQAIGGRLALGRVNRAEAAGQAGAASAFSRLFDGGAAAPAAPVPGDVLAGGGGTDTLSGGGGIPDVAAQEAYIRASAPKYGVDPDIAVKVARSEGLQPGTWQSNVMGKGGRETSYGPYQLLVGGGLGDEFQRTTGLNAADPSTWQKQIDFALGQAGKSGWSPWMGAAKVGVGPRTGIGGAPAVTAALAGGGGSGTLAGGAGRDPLIKSGDFNFTPFATGGAAARPDSFSGLQPAMSSGLGAMISSAPPDIQAELKVLSGYRSPETQERLWQGALKKYGSASAARKWVAPPGRSQHGAGNAIDWKFGSQRARDWVHKNAAQYGFSFPLGNEPWHMEVAGARGKGPPSRQSASGIGRPIDSTGGSVFALAGGGGQPAVTSALMGSLIGPREEPVSSQPTVAEMRQVGDTVGREGLAASGLIDPTAKDDFLPANIPAEPAFRPAGGPTPYSAGATVLGGGSANAGTLTPVPDPNMRPAVAPVVAPETPPVVPAAPAATGVPPVARALGYDPLPQTSDEHWSLRMPGHESLSPSARTVSQALGGGGGTNALAGGGGRGFFGRLFGGGTGTPAAAAGGGGGVPSAAATGAPGAGGAAGTSGAPGAGGGFSPQAQAAIQFLTNTPFASDEQKAVAKTILDNEIAQADPLHQAQLAKVRYDLAVSQAKDPIEIAKAKADLDRLLTPTKLLTPDEVKAAGLPDYGRWSVDDDGNYKLIEGTKPDTFRNATPEEAAAHGAATGQIGPNGQFHPDTVPSDMTLQRDGTGEYRLVPKSEAGPTFEQTSAFRKELLSQQGQIRFRTTAPQLASMSAAINEPTAMSDLDFVYGMAQIFDPTSSVREGEMGMVITGQSVPESIIGRVMKMTEGGAELGVQGRRDLFSAVQRRVEQYHLQAEDEAKAYTDIATKMKIPDPTTVIVPLPNMPSWPKMTREQYDALTPGTVFVDSKGRVVRKPLVSK